MKVNDLVKVKIFHNDGIREEIILFLEDYMPYEPSNYVTDPCYIAAYGEEIYFLYESGMVGKVIPEEDAPYDDEITLGTYKVLESIPREDNGNGEGYWKCSKCGGHTIDCPCNFKVGKLEKLLTRVADTVRVTYIETFKR